jgi:hypothetical protein
MTGKNKVDKAVAKAAAAMEKSKPATRSDVQQKQQAAAAAASRSREPSGLARSTEVISTPHKRKGDDIAASEREPKKATVEDDSDVEEMEEEDGGRTRDDKYRKFCEGMRELMEEFPQAKRKVEVLMRLMNDIIQDTRKMAAEDARQAVNKDADMLQCTESVMMYNVHKIKFQNIPIYEVSTFEEKLTDEIHHLTRGRVQAMRITVMQRAENGKPMTVRVKLGSQQQRGMLYKMLGVSKKYVPESQDVFAGVAFRDCFPFELLPEVRRLSGEGMEAKRNGECVAFRVTSTGGRIGACATDQKGIWRKMDCVCGKRDQRGRSRGQGALSKAWRSRGLRRRSATSGMRCRPLSPRERSAVNRNSGSGSTSPRACWPMETARGHWLSGGPTWWPWRTLLRTFRAGT